MLGLEGIPLLGRTQALPGQAALQPARGLDPEEFVAFCCICHGLQLPSAVQAFKYNQVQLCAFSAAIALERRMYEGFKFSGLRGLAVFECVCVLSL